VIRAPNQAGKIHRERAAPEGTGFVFAVNPKERAAACFGLTADQTPKLGGSRVSINIGFLFVLGAS